MSEKKLSLNLEKTKNVIEIDFMILKNGFMKITNLSKCHKN